MLWFLFILNLLIFTNTKEVFCGMLKISNWATLDKELYMVLMFKTVRGPDRSGLSNDSESSSERHYIYLEMSSALLIDAKYS